ncbi:acetate kinase [Pseudogymnoascus sp. WSF 3629]|nr:acetate kinase [Pseudogymnoascus sp. WSF 3629]
MPTKPLILAVNAGSSSVKVSVYTLSSSEPHQIAEAQLDGLTAPPAKLSYTRGSTTVSKGKEQKQDVEDQGAAFSILLDELVNDSKLTELARKEDITHVCHRVVHGGDYSKQQAITKETLQTLEELSSLAPLHNAPALSIVRSCLDKLPGTRNIACFDTQFHRSLPEHVRTYPINQEVARKNGLRKYGFHGLSYSFITRAVAGFLGKKPEETSLIALHLGSGASACAIKGGKSWDTSMGLTPLAGLPGATRSGSLDPSLVFHYASDVGKLSPASTKDLHVSRAEDILNKQSGWKALTGTTDFGAISAGYDKDPAKKLAFDLFVDRICGFIGAYYVSLHGEVDALVFAGGIGEKGAELRKSVVERCACLGFAIGEEANGKGGGDDVVRDISGKGKHKVLICKTDEQLEMAREVVEIESLSG